MKKLFLAALASGLFFSTTVQAEKVVVIPLAASSDSKSFYLTLDADNEEKTIATHGPLRIFARCIVNEDDGAGVFFDRVEIVGTSSEAPWYEEDESDCSNCVGNALPADAEVIIFTQNATHGTAVYDNDIDDGSLIGPGGYYLAIDGEMLGLGVNIYSHACTVVGEVLGVKAK